MVDVLGFGCHLVLNGIWAEVERVTAGVHMLLWLLSGLSRVAACCYPGGISASPQAQEFLEVGMSQNHGVS